MIREPLVKKATSDELRAARITEPPVDLSVLAQRNALRVVHVESLPNRARAWIFNAAGRIEVLASLGPVVERFAIAHELGHHLLEHGGDRSCYDVVPAVEATPLDETDTGVSFEAEASAFASHLLVPRPWLREAVTSDLTIPELLARFEVSKPVLWIALDQAKLINKINAG